MADEKKVADNKTFIIAILVIGSFILIFGLVVFYKDIDTVKTVAAIWGGWVGAVIGYFFGARPVEPLINKIDGITKLGEQRLADLEEEKRKLQQKSLDYEQLKGELIQKNEKAMSDLEKAKEFIENIKKKYLE